MQGFLTPNVNLVQSQTVSLHSECACLFSELVLGKSHKQDRLINHKTHTEKAHDCLDCMASE